MANCSTAADPSGPIGILDDTSINLGAQERQGCSPSDLTDVFIEEDTVCISEEERGLAMCGLSLVSIHHSTHLSFRDDQIADSLIEYREYTLCCRLR